MPRAVRFGNGGIYALSLIVPLQFCACKTAGTISVIKIDEKEQAGA
jgi:hypothetical protein